MKKYSKHGMTRTRFYRIWCNIKTRCDCEKSKSFHSYGGRGIKMCSEWYDFTHFYRDLYDKYIEHAGIHGEKNTTIDRIDVNGNYCKENCRWATQKVQNNNRRDNRKFNGESWTEISLRMTNGLHGELVRARIEKLGWSIEKAVSTPPSYHHNDRVYPKKIII